MGFFEIEAKERGVINIFIYLLLSYFLLTSEFFAIIYNSIKNPKESRIVQA